MDLRPCYEGFSGIPQEARLLFNMFSGFPLRRLGGLASGIQFTSRHAAPRSDYERTLEQTKALASQDTRRIHWTAGFNALPTFVKRRIWKPYFVLTEAFRREKLDLEIDAKIFEDYLWVKLFERTLPPRDRTLLSRANFFATELGYEYARILAMLPRMFARRVDSRGWNIFFAAGVSPYRMAPGTKTIIRYYDALPLLSPHTVDDPWPHAMSHGRMMQRNIAGGAHFICDSEPVRNDVLRLFPEAEKRVETIPVMLAPEFRPDPRPAAEIDAVIARYGSPATRVRRTMPKPVKPPRLVMAVSTLEPRKNYLKLFRAFEIAQRIAKEPMRLLVVANAGWRTDAELAELKTMVRRGACHLSDVPLADLRILYANAHCVVAPSRAEGFDYSGVEAMACGTPLLASAIAVHRWVYGEAAEYFDPYDEAELGRMIAGLIDLPRGEGKHAEMSALGLRRAALYRTEVLAPRWEAAIGTIAATAMVRN